MKLQWLTLLLLSTLALMLTGDARAADPDLEKLQGRWIVESLDYNGATVAEAKDAVREFIGEQYTLTPVAGEAYKGIARLDSTTTPKQIDLELSDRTLPGIYEIDGDTLRMCYALEGGQRPAEMASKPDSGLVLVVHKRAK